MADDDANLPADYDLVPVDHTPQFSDAPIPKAGQTVQQPNVMGDISSIPGKVASTVGDVTGVSDAYKAATGQMTPEEAQMFALGALPMLAGGPEAKAAQEAAPFAARMFHGSPVTDLSAIKAVPPAARQFDNATSQLGAWFAPTEQAAQRYAGNTGRVYTTNLSLSKPYEMPWSEFNYLQSPHKGPEGETLPGEQWAARADQLKEEAASQRDELKSAGYDGVVVRNTKGDPVEVASFGDVPIGIRAYHGSPYDFNQFDLSKIGTGEGAQAYGHGLYFAENPETALSYRNQLAPRDVLLKRNGKAFDPLSSDDVIDRVTGGELVESQYPTFDSAISAINKKMAAYDPSLNLPDYSLLKQMRDRVQDWKDSGVKLNAAEKGKMYEVNINADPEHFLDWDKPLSEQHPVVQDLARNADLSHLAPGNRTRRQIEMWREGTLPNKESEPNGHVLHNALTDYGTNTQDNAALTEQLKQAGIPGIKYLDQGSRSTGTGTRNYVVFDPKTIDIVKKYGLAGLVAGGASHFSTVPVDHQPDFPDQNGMADGGTVDDATDPNNSIAPLATALNQAVPNFDPEAAGFRPSTNIEDVRNKPLWRKAIEVITRKPLPGDLTNYAKGGGVKATKTQANYRGGTANKRCGICSMFQPPRGCSAVRGVISPQALCDFYEPKKAEKKNDVKIDATHDGPWMSCMSIDGATMYRNKNVPATANIKGKTVDVDDMLLHHEVPERADLEKLIAEFKQRFHREPNKNERKAIYLKAHNRSGTPNERAHAKKIGVDWKAWSAWCRGEESKIEKMKFTNQPKDADVKPIPHSHEELEAMDHASAA